MATALPFSACFSFDEWARVRLDAAMVAWDCEMKNGDCEMKNGDSDGAQNLRDEPV
jgi:hypothetical protein